MTQSLKQEVNIHMYLCPNHSLFKEGTMKNDAKHVFHRGVVDDLQSSIKSVSAAKPVCCAPL